MYPIPDWDGLKYNFLFQTKPYQEEIKRIDRNGNLKPEEKDELIKDTYDTIMKPVVGQPSAPTKVFR